MLINPRKGQKVQVWYRESARSHLAHGFRDAIQVAARGVDVMIVRQRGCQAPVDNVFADTRHTFLQEFKKFPRQFFLLGFVVGGAGAGF